MQLTFYSCSDPINKMNKSLSALGSTSYFKPTYSNGSTSVSYLLDNGMPGGTNYVYDDVTNRYYIVVEVIHNTARSITINCVLDALYTFRGKLSGTFYFVRGDDKVNEMEDGNYPLSDYIQTETFNIDGWDKTFFKNVAAGKHFLLRTAATGTAKVKRTVTASIGDKLRWQNVEYTISGSDSDAGFIINDDGYAGVIATQPTGISVKSGDLVKIGAYTYLFRNDITSDPRVASLSLYST